MKKMLSIIVCLLVITSLAACNTAATSPSPSVSLTPVPITAHSTPAPTPSPATASPVPTVELATPAETPEETAEPEDIVEPEETPETDPNSFYAKAGLTYSQFDKLNYLISSSLYMGLFSKTSSLKNNDYWNFIFDFFNNNPYIDFGDDWYLVPDSNQNIHINTATAQKIIDSAFANKFKLSNKVRTDNVFFQDGKCYIIVGNLYYRDWPNIYRIQRISNGKYKVYINMTYLSGDGGTYKGKAIAVVQKDDDSIFGFHILSLTKNNTSRPKVVSVSASSYLPKSGTRTYHPNNVIDNKNKTVWAPMTGENEWIQLNFAQMQKLSGVIVRLGDWSSESALEKSSADYYLTLEFSNGTKMDVEMSTTYMDYNNPYILFDKEVTTKYVKITVNRLDYVYEDIKHSLPGCISEISPF